MFEKVMEISMLFDFYGQLLTRKQREILQLYYEENLTLAEIAEILGISRQAVHDSARKAERSLRAFEDALGLARRFKETEEAISTVKDCIDQALATHRGDDALETELGKIRAIIETINE